MLSAAKVTVQLVKPCLIPGSLSQLMAHERKWAEQAAKDSLHLLARTRHREVVLHVWTRKQVMVSSEGRTNRQEKRWRTEGASARQTRLFQATSLSCAMASQAKAILSLSLYLELAIRQAPVQLLSATHPSRVAATAISKH